MYVRVSVTDNIRVKSVIAEVLNSDCINSGINHSMRKVGVDNAYRLQISAIADSHCVKVYGIDHNNNTVMLELGTLSGLHETMGCSTSLIATGVMDYSFSSNSSCLYDNILINTTWDNPNYIVLVTLGSEDYTEYNYAEYVDGYHLLNASPPYAGNYTVEVYAYHPTYMPLISFPKPIIGSIEFHE
jgi:hypothetical protein